MKRIKDRYTLPMLLIVTGIIWAVRNSNIFTDNIEQMLLGWPSIVLAAGGVMMIFSRWKFIGASSLLTGGVFLVGNILGYAVVDLWPVALIAVGILSLFVIPFTGSGSDLLPEISGENIPEQKKTTDIIKNFTPWKTSDGPQVKFFVN